MRSLSLALCLAGLAVCLTSSAAGVRVPPSPVGTTWDCIVSGGGQQGMAFLTFADDGTNRTFSGYQILVPPPRKAPPVPSTRNIAGVVGRYPEPNTNVVQVQTNVYGFGPVNGRWDYDERGRVIGSFMEDMRHVEWSTNENITRVISTTPVSVTNADGSVTTYTTNVVLSVTNYVATSVTNGRVASISFLARVIANRNLSLVTSSPMGRTVYAGVPYRPANVVDLSGSWSAIKRQGRVATVEFFSLASASNPNPFVPTNTSSVYFTTNGQFAGSLFEGITMLSSRRRVGFVFNTYDADADPGQGKLSAAYGTLVNTRRFTRATTRGVEEPNNPFTFNATRQNF